MTKTVICDLGGVCFTEGSSIAIERIAGTYKIPREKVRRLLMGDLGT